MSEQVEFGRKRNPRPTIGLFTFDWGQNGGQAFEVWTGMNAAAQDLDLNLLCFSGGALQQWGQSRSQRQILSELAVPEHVDGLVTFEWWANRETFEWFYENFRPLPVVNVMRFYEGYPGVAMDNYRDMLTLMSHLVETHGCRHIAYTNGWAENSTQQVRYQAYQDALGKYGIPVNLGLVLSQGYPETEPHGARLVRYMMDDQGLRPGADFDAIVGFNDEQVLQAMEALQARDVRIPYEVAVAGIDDIPASKFSTPPLTTLAMPRYEMGYKAVELLLAQIQGQEVPEQTVVPARLILRQSCGCLPALIQDAGNILKLASTRSKKQSFDTVWQAKRGEILAEMLQAIETEGAQPFAGWAEQMFAAFSSDIVGTPAGRFLPILDQVLRPVIQNRQRVADWQAVISTLRRHLLACVSGQDEETLYRAETLLGQARVFLHEMERVMQAQVQEHVLQRAELLRNASQALVATPDLNALIGQVAQQLPEFGIDQCYLSVYQDSSAPETQSRLLLAYDGEQRLELQSDETLFSTSQLMPAAVWPADHRYTLDVEPLYVRQAHVGLAVLGMGANEWEVYEALRVQLSSALRGALLLQERDQVNQALAREQYLMQALMDNAPDYIYFKDTESRFIRTSRSHARSFGLDDPAEMVGKSDFDFFTEAHARPAYEAEQQIIQTGEPVLDLEERETRPDSPDTWALTTKLPLRDEQGNIVGTFGISRDITEQRRSQQALQDAYRERERRALQLETVAELSSVASSLIDLDELIQRVVDLAQERFGLYYVGLLLVDDTGGRTGEADKWAVLRAGTGEAGKTMIENGHRLRVGGMSMVGRCIATGQADIQQHVGEAAVRFANPLLPDTRSEMALPLVTRGEAIGALTIQSAQEAAFTPEDISVFQSMANQVANAIANARLVETAQNRLREMEILQQVSAAVSSMFDLDYTLDAAVRALADEMAFTYIAINLIDRAANELWTSRGFGLAASLNGMVRSLDQLQGDILLDIAGKQEIEVIDGWDDRFDREIWEKGGHQNLVRAYVPLVMRGESVGILEVGYDRYERATITPEEVRLLRSIGERVAVAVENARLLEETRAYAAQQGAIADISARMQQATDIESLMQITSEELGRALNASRVYVRIGT
ncbi:MAG: substrate-binding domain-containing protein [Anaerolineae bacterium]|nr:substrate-binding domain-containing protein [Anaerolineae bacterium]